MTGENGNVWMSAGAIMLGCVWICRTDCANGNGGDGVCCEWDDGGVRKPNPGIFISKMSCMGQPTPPWLWMEAHSTPVDRLPVGGYMRLNLPSGPAQTLECSASLQEPMLGCGGSQGGRSGDMGAV